jgi:hypothetical protein
MPLKESKEGQENTSTTITENACGAMEGKEDKEFSPLSSTCIPLLLSKGRQGVASKESKESPKCLPAKEGQIDCAGTESKESQESTPTRIHPYKSNSRASHSAPASLSP